MRTAAPRKSCPTDLVARCSGWPLERVLFAMAGTMTIVGALLGALVSPWFLLSSRSSASTSGCSLPSVTAPRR